MFIYNLCIYLYTNDTLCNRMTCKENDENSTNFVCFTIDTICTHWNVKCMYDGDSENSLPIDWFCGEKKNVLFDVDFIVGAG